MAIQIKKNPCFIITLIGLGVTAACENLPSQYGEPSQFRIRGITLADWTPDGYSQEASNTAIRSISSAGANQMVAIVTAYQPDRDSNNLAMDPLRTPTKEALRHALSQALGEGMSVAVKPHVDLDDGTWRGFLSPLDPKVWFQKYQEFVLPLAEVAEASGATHFVVGTELAGTIKYEQFWLETIARIRTVFGGELVYAASWDEAQNVPFWRALDLVGINFFFPVTVRNNPGRLEILMGWQPWLQRLSRLHRQSNRKIILTEIGYRSVDGAGLHPFDFAQPGALDLAEQADLYWAALEATKDISWLEGIYWWNWLASGSGGPRNRDYTPADKPAEDELRARWAPSD